MIEITPGLIFIQLLCDKLEKNIKLNSLDYTNNQHGSKLIRFIWKNLEPKCHEFAKTLYGRNVGMLR